MFTFGLFVFLCTAVALWLPIIPVKGPAVDNTIAVPPPAYRGLSLAARAAFVLDVKTGKTLYSFNGDAQLPLASLTKIMMAVTALSLLPEDSVITVKPSFLAAEGDSGLYGNERWRFSDLLDLTLVESSNDGANAIALTVGQMISRQTAAAVNSVLSGAATDDLGRSQFVAAMNKKAKELSLAQTYFLNPTGLDESTDVSGGYGSARDIALLFAYAEKNYPKIFGATRYVTREFNSLSSLKHTVKNTNVFVSEIPSLLGSKTGYTDLAGGNLVISFDAGPARPIVVSVLGSTEQGRFDDTLKLVTATLEYLSQNV